MPGDAASMAAEMTPYVSAAMAGPATALGLLPRDVPKFTGRAAELAQLAGLGPGGSAVVTAMSAQRDD